MFAWATPESYNPAKKASPGTLALLSNTLRLPKHHDMGPTWA